MKPTTPSASSSACSAPARTRSDADGPPGVRGPTAAKRRRKRSLLRLYHLDMNSRATPIAETWVQRAEATLAAAGHKRGGARRAVVELLDGQQCALTAVEIEDALRGESRRVSRASIYRILDELERLRLLQRVETGQA